LLENILKFIVEHSIGDLASILGLFVSVIGFAFTIWGVSRSKKAAEAAKESAMQVQNELRKLDIIIDFSTVITMIDEVKRHHRGANWHILPDRYSAIRKNLISIKSTYKNLTENHQKVIQGAISQIKTMESTIEKSLSGKNQTPNIAKLNEIITNESDKLNEVLADMKSNMEIENYGR
jgi:hypothetical protein